MTLRSMAELVGGVALAATAVGLQLERNAMRAEHLAGLNAAAAADTTQHRLVGQLEVARRQAEQLHVTLDAKTHESNDRGVALANLRVQFDSVARDTSGTVEPDTVAGLVGLRAEGMLNAWDSAGVNVHASVNVIGVGAGNPSANWHWALQRRPLDLTADFSCRRDTALVHVTGPAWAKVDVVHGVLDPAICNPPPRWNPLSFQLPSLPVAGALLLVGYVLHR